MKPALFLLALLAACGYANTSDYDHEQELAAHWEAVRCEYAKENNEEC